MKRLQLECQGRNEVTFLEGNDLNFILKKILFVSENVIRIRVLFSSVSERDDSSNITIEVNLTDTPTK